jgi:hypothetical protein
MERQTVLDTGACILAAPILDSRSSRAGGGPHGRPQQADEVCGSIRRLVSGCGRARELRR